VQVTVIVDVVVTAASATGLPEPKFGAGAVTLQVSACAPVQGAASHTTVSNAIIQRFIFRLAPIIQSTNSITIQ
ncbi:hypothetical protein, partial [Clostridioides difficile]|uniref:hypothetical protein n=1 Tax=Clostridioides difficile TaxID=1496 RepID=UPI00210B8CFB